MALDDEDEVIVADTLSGLLAAEKHRYIEKARQDGGSAEGFRKRIRGQYSRDHLKFESLMLDALMEAATRAWEKPPRKSGPDLFSIAGVTIPEFLTRPAARHVSGDELETEELFEKVSYKFATVRDLREDATIKMRKAAQSSAAAELEMRAADEAYRRARGNERAFLHDVMDEQGK
jgi:hypothetical protein